ncbi:phage tail protein [Escherichia coli]|uniref:Phage tail protein n=2 Tax=Escherichia coli TaxID=562 RepID=A0A8S7QV05_ECOLX|nr:phage tail protein [Escherichia coli]EFW7524473.1 phage tail protein [Shigella sonnei]EET5075683.1 phage tail protein [Escherichia coli]EET5155059.1 phage tail protein [Escherichia coli]EET6277589.1 phage tail protein [Escherichia coli]EET7290067.1 phage tail protein [Escherichia coli]
MSTTTRKFKTIITDTGTKKLAQAAAPDGKPVRLTHMAVGDGGGTLPTPDSKQTRLVHEVWRHTVNRVILDATHQNRIIAELVIPPETGGFWIREIGVFDEHGDLIAVGNTAESYKPAVAEGSGRAQTFRTILTVSSTATVALTVDNTMVMATVDYVDDKLKEHEQSRRHPDASLTAKGFVQLSSATNSDSETLAATPKAVKAAYDLANGKYTAQDATTARKGIVQLSSATNSTSETLAATPKAVKAVMDETNKKAPLNSPALTGTPTTPTARQGTNNTQIASTAFVMAAIAALVDSSPDALNTLNELAAALGNDPNFATTMTNALAGKQPKDATLTALAGLATAADRFPYFTGNDVASLATLTEVGRDILAKSTVAAVIEYLGLRELGTSGEKIPLLSTANTWTNRQTFSGGLSGELSGNAATATKLKTARKIAGVGFDGSSDISISAKNVNAFALRQTGNTVNGDTSVGWNWDSGAYNALIGGASALILHFNINAGSCPAVQFRVNYKNGGISYRSARDGYGFELGWSDFYTTTRKPSAGDVGAYTRAECNSRFITGIRLGGLSSVQTWNGPGWSDRSGYVVTGSVNGNRDELIDTTQARPIQYCINGTWYNAGSI